MYIYIMYYIHILCIIYVLCVILCYIMLYYVMLYYIMLYIILYYILYIYMRYRGIRWSLIYLGEFLASGQFALRGCKTTFPNALQFQVRDRLVVNVGELGGSDTSRRVLAKSHKLQLNKFAVTLIEQETQCSRGIAIKADRRL